MYFYIYKIDLYYFSLCFYLSFCLHNFFYLTFVYYLFSECSCFVFDGVSFASEYLTVFLIKFMR